MAASTRDEKTIGTNEPMGTVGSTKTRMPLLRAVRQSNPVVIGTNVIVQRPGTSPNLFIQTSEAIPRRLGEWDRAVRQRSAF
jgi:hypothetical protein